MSCCKYTDFKIETEMLLYHYNKKKYNKINYLQFYKHSLLDNN